ncbi:MAG: sensor histidine kinase [Sphingobacteriales bacterium JAD_PAG50586_3]|nr:MAG: sensor histidine kinase [Sphingobacteriales bacterium JAD_PAG50586_3]
MNKQWGILLLLLVNLVAKGNLSDTIVFNSNTELVISNNVFIYKDKSTKLGFKDVSKSTFINNFKAPEFNVPSYNTSNVAYWVCFNIKNNTGEDIALMVDYPMLDTVQYFGVDKAGIVDSFYSGSAYPFSQRQIDNNRIIFELKSDITTIYLRVRSSYNLQLPLTLYSYEKLNSTIGKENFYQGSYFGFVILIVIYGLLIYISSRDSIYIYYLLHVAVTGLIMAHLSGYTFQNLWPNYPYLNNLEPSLFGLSAISLLFSMRFLETEKNTPHLHKWFWVIIGITLLAFPLNAFANGYYAIQIVQAANIAGSILMIFTGLLLLRRGFRPARHFTFAWSFLLIGIIITLVQRFGLLPYKWYFAYAWQIGSAFDITFLSIAVADRIALLREEAHLSQQQSLVQINMNKALVLEQNEVLKQKVQERTAELEANNIELEKLNNTKDKLFSIVAHDLKGPMGNIHKFIEMMIEDKDLRDDETLTLLKGSAANTYNLLDNLLTWARSQRGEIDCKNERLNLHEVSGYPTEVLKLQMIDKHIQFENNIPNDIYVMSDVPVLRTILRNLMSNAIKFTKPGGKITLEATRIENNMIKVDVTDTGVGIAPDRIAGIFEPVKNKNTKGTAGEKGTGLGLLITAEFVQLCKGNISAVSLVDEGTTISFTLPEA